MVLASSQDTWGLHRESQGPPPQWSSGAAASGKALEKESWEPGRGNYTLQSLKGGLGCFLFILSLGAEGQGGSPLRDVRIATERQQIPTPEELGPKKDIFGQQCASDRGVGSQPRGVPMVWTRVLRCPHVTHKALLWLRAATGINLLGFPWLDSRDRTGKLKRSVPIPRPLSWLLPLPGPHISCLCR